MGNAASSQETSSMVSFDTLAKKYYSNPEIVAKVEDYEMNGDRMIFPDGSTVHGTIPTDKPMVIQDVDYGNQKGMPVFDFVNINTRDKDGTCILREKGKLSGEMIIVFIPAGCRDGSICNTMQPYKKEINEAGVSSFWHLLAITENVTYCNPVTLKKDQLNIVRDKKQLLEKAMRILVSGSETDIGSFQWMKNLDGFVTMKDGTEIPINIVKEDLSDDCIQNFEKFVSSDDITEDVMENIGYFYHAYDQATVFSGHMHALAMDYRTKCYDYLEDKAQEEGLIKNIPVQEIIQYVELGKIDELKFDAMQRYSQLQDYCQPEPEPEPEPEYDEDGSLTRTRTSANRRR